MRYQLDSELLPVITALAQKAASAPPRDKGDVRALRETANAGLAYMATLVPPTKGVRTAKFQATAQDGSEIELWWYSKEEGKRGPAVVYAHGGGRVAGDLDLYDEVVSWYTGETGVPFLSVKYRLAPEARGITPTEDVFAGFVWLIEHAESMGVDPKRIAVMGDSGGGAPAAGAAILARERGIALARQILIYPMLDDRNVAPGRLPSGVLTWTYENNFTGWSASLGEDRGSDSVSPIAAPARLTEFAGLAPAYIEVGDLDIFRDESIAYAQGLARAGVPIELHVHPGAPHGFERLAPASKVAQRAFLDRARVVDSL